jgi:hypothetical protein
LSYVTGNAEDKKAGRNPVVHMIHAGCERPISCAKTTRGAIFAT